MGVSGSGSKLAVDCLLMLLYFVYDAVLYLVTCSIREWQFAKSRVRGSIVCATGVVSTFVHPRSNQIIISSYDAPIILSNPKAISTSLLIQLVRSSAKLYLLHLSTLLIVLFAVSAKPRSALRSWLKRKRSSCCATTSGELPRPAISAQAEVLDKLVMFVSLDAESLCLPRDRRSSPIVLVSLSGSREEVRNIC